MKRLAALTAFSLAGFVTAIAVMRIVAAFDHNPGCGLDCASPDLSAALLSGFATILAFPVLGFFFTRGKYLGVRRVIAVLVMLVLTAILAATGRYVFELHSHYIEAEAARPVQPNLDFMHMAIATRDVQTYTEAENGRFKPASVIHQWQRCAIGGASCGKQPSQARMLCKTGVVYVNEPDWSGFSLIPGENLDVAPAIKSMHLCAPDNEAEP